MSYAFLLFVGAVEPTGEYGAGSYLEIGGISLGLTVLNIVCIWGKSKPVRGVAPNTLTLFALHVLTPKFRYSSGWTNHV